MSTVNPVAPVGPDKLSLITRIGMALGAPRWALAVAGDSANAGRASSDVLMVMLALLLGAHLRGLVAGAWMGGALGMNLGLRALIVVVSGALTTTLAFLMISTLALFITGGKARSLPRAFDLASVALVPMLTVQLVVSAVVRLVADRAPTWLSYAATGVAFAWGGIVVANAVRVARQRLTVRAIAPARVVGSSQRVGQGWLALVGLAVIAQLVWIGTHIDQIRPLRIGDAAPTFAVSTVDVQGKLGPAWTLASAGGKPVILDFWATWCGPCRAAMPALATVTKNYAGRVEVVGINLDDAAAAAAIFEREQLPMRLLFDNTHAADVFGVTSIPHVVLLDQQGHVRQVWRGGADIATMSGALDQLLAK